MTVIDDIKDRIDIIDVVSETVKLKKSGRTYTGFCPFHANTRTPSFVVWPESGTWKCFGACNTGGDVFTYLMKRDGLEFKEALHELGRRAGIEIVEEHRPEAEIEDQHLARLREAVAAAAQWFNHLLNHNPQAQIARDHLFNRGISAQTIETFQLGYALESWDALHNHLLQKGFSNEELIDAGLLVQREDERTGAMRTFDRFRNRVMIPIHDGKGRPIGFGARALKDGDEPKYLNSPQTALFDKSHTLFALHAARQLIRDQKVAVIVEGYMDALAAHQHNFHNVVASLGTALTEHQFKQLQKLAPRIVLALDPDTAGINAMLRGLDVARETLDREAAPIFNPRGLMSFASKLQIDIRVLTVPDGKDPDELMEDDPLAWMTLVDNAPPVVPFVIEALSMGRDLNDPREKAKLSKEVLPIIRDVADPVEQTVYIQQLARHLQVEERAMFDQMRVVNAAPTRVPQRTRPRAAPVPEIPKRDTTDLEFYCLSLLLRHPHVLNAIDELLDRAELSPLQLDDFEQLPNREVFRALQAAIVSDPAPTLDEVRHELDETLHPQLAALFDEANERLPIDRGLSLEGGAQKAGLQLRERRLKREGQQLRALLQDTPPDPEVLAALMQVGRDNAADLLRLQQILTARTITRTTDPWGRS